MGKEMKIKEEWIQETMRAYFVRHGLVAHQLDSYNHFMSVLFEQILFENNTIQVTEKQNTTHQHTFAIQNVVLNKPMIEESSGYVHQLLPSEARKRGVSYFCDVLIDLLYEKRVNGNLEFSRNYREVLFCQIPCMVRSRFCHLTTTVQPSKDECWYDEGGYFIVKGQERVILAQEKVRNNMPYVRPIKKSQFVYACEIRSWNEQKIRSTSTLTCYLYEEKGGEKLPLVKVSLPFVDFNIPLPIVFRLIGVSKKEQMIQFIDAPKDILHLVQNVVRDTQESKSDAELYEWIGKNGTREATVARRYRYVSHIFQNEFLPHVGLTVQPETRMRKAQFLGYAIRKLLLVYLGRLESDDRDDYSNKRLETAGMLMALLFRQHLRTFLKGASALLQRTVDGGKFVDVMTIMRAKRITSGFKYAFSSGNWGVQKGGNSNQNGVAQILIRGSPLATLSLLRRVNKPMNREAKIHKPRLLHGSHMGIVCAVETPEGSPCGLVMSLALSTYVRPGIPTKPVIELLLGMPEVDRIGTSMNSNSCRILINGNIFAVTVEPSVVFRRLKHMRQVQDLPFCTSFFFSELTYELRISTDAGGCVRPLFVVENLDKLPEVLHYSKFSTQDTWTTLLLEGVIEYVDKEEERMYRVAIRPEDLEHCGNFTHVEISPLFHFGLCANLIPFANHNQAPRNIYSSAQMRQAIGIPHTQWQSRMETCQVLDYPQRPCVSPSISSMLGFDEVPAGQNPIVAILSHPFTQEDAIVFNKSSIELGMFRSTHYRTYRDQEKENGTDRQSFGIPNPESTIGMKHANYTGILDEDGMRRPGDSVRKGDVLICKSLTRRGHAARSKNTDWRKDVSLILQDNGIHQATVDACMVATTPDGKRYCRCRLRSVRQPDIGNKFASRHGQKGVIGLIVPREDMPFTRSGISPDMIINSHCLISRKTLGQLFETVLGKAACLSGKIGNGTNFRGLTAAQLGDILEANGAERHSEEIMIDGKTGKTMEARVFIGPTFYQALRHMSQDKVHARARGKYQILTRAPLDGRSRQGGLRVGPMERGCLATHGAAWMIKDRLMDSADAFTTVICNKCGLLAERVPSEIPRSLGREGWCRNCQSSEFVKRVTIPYAFKLLLQELAAAHIGCRIQVGENPDRIHYSPILWRS